MISETGVWSEEEQHAHIFSYNVARWVKNLINKTPESMYLYDLGCGNGKYTEYFNEVGIFCQGFDGYYPNNKIKRIYQYDLTTELDLRAASNILCLEVWEHIPPQYEDVFVNNIINNLKGYLILSVAVEGQEGLGHVNCRSNEYVIDKLQSKGLKYNEHLTNEMRKEPENYVAYFRETLMVFEK
jgi:2-polyprenyl-3-methyl-5-hydroxy-6-metoxy-1,4-benzoquinol methylase